MRILITGGFGLLGVRTAAFLRAGGHEPLLFDRVLRSTRPAAIGDAPAFQGDILDWPGLVRVLQETRPDVVVHTAGLLTPAAVANPFQAVQVNYLGTVHVLEAARLAGVRRVAFCSSATVYDNLRTTDRPVREDDPLDPRTIYATTKAAADFTGLNYRAFGLEFVSCRFAALYGPGPSQSGVAGLWIDPLLRALVCTGTAEVERSARRAMEYVYVEDAAQALSAAATATGLTQNIYNIGEGQQRSMDEILAVLRELIPGAVIRERPGPPKPSPYPEARHPMDHSAARRDLGYQVEYPMPRGLAEYVNYLRREPA